MTDPSSSSNRAPSIAPGPASPSVSSARMVPPRPRPQPTPVVSDSSAPPHQRSASAASSSSSRHQAQPQQQVRRQPSREGAAPSSQQTPSTPAQRPTSSASMRPSLLQGGRPPFAPLYTLVANATSDMAYHPRVHYIFNDDDENEALAQALNHAAHRQQQHQQHQRIHSGGGNLRPPFQAPSRSASGSEDSLAHGNRDRALLLDLTRSADGGWEVAHASSLSADWAVVSAQVSRLQEGDGSAQDDEGQQSLMLKIEGVDGPGQAHHAHTGDAGALEGSRGSAGRASSTQSPEYGAILEEFEKKMGVLRQVVDAGEEKRKAEGSGRAELGVVEEESTEGEK
ncbi:hypothetical protein MKZ38_009546 [Zalerion maritima]|uniref:Uncharacterized protein n=1 Tax=Zalerion maritima TaxID=339359 RepID=A0AAD5RGA5_9PEZI|nr:hypothetical protein MKZ38_009546 [Zalerion maritima]